MSMIDEGDDISFQEIDGSTEHLPESISSGVARTFQVILVTKVFSNSHIQLGEKMILVLLSQVLYHVIYMLNYLYLW